jgi:RimJ/RimL family protein N-acetyltransferase
VTLKDGQAAALSWIEKEDLPELMGAFNSIVREGKYLLVDQEVNSLDFEYQWFYGNWEAGVQELIARVDDKIVGAANISPLTGKRAHVAEFGIFIIKKCRNMGLGTILLRELVQVAKDGGFEVFQLSAFSTNKRALHLYKKCGFQKRGRLFHEFKFKDGTYADEVIMELLLIDF